MTDAERDELLSRLDERTEKIPELARAVEDLKREVDRRFDALTSQFITRGEFDALSKTVESKVSKDTFEPVRLTVYGGVGLILVGVFGALIALVVRQ